jgi:Tfp pilus assembly PilM family ATPase
VAYTAIEKVLGQFAQRLIAVDLGSSHLKVILVEQNLGRLRVLQHQIVDLQGEGLLSLEEINRHLQAVVASLGNHPLALAIPQHLSTSHLVDLPRVGDREIRSLVEKETVNLSGLSESAIVYDYQPLKPFGKHQHPFWVTISREQEIEKQINRLGGEEEERCICEVTTVANAMIAAYLACARAEERRVLVDLGATNTVVAIIDQGQGVYATSFPIGGESFTNAVATLRKCSFEEAELLKRSQDLLTGPNALPGFQTVVEVWRQDLMKLIREWAEDNFERIMLRPAFKVVLCGGGSEQPGLVEYLRQEPDLEFEVWPNNADDDAGLPMKRCAAAYGLALQALRQIKWPASLLPTALRTAKQRQRLLMTANWAGFFLLALVLACLIIGTARKWSLAGRKAKLVRNVQLAVQQAEDIEGLIAKREQDYGRVRLLVERRTRTMDFLKTLQILQQVREKKDLWFVLLADQGSYFAGTTVGAAETNQMRLADSAAASNRVEHLGGFIAEVAIPGKDEERLRVLHELVEGLKKEKLFRNVDSLPASQRSTNFFDPKILAPERYFSLSLDLVRRGETSTPVLADKRPSVLLPFPPRTF